MRYNSGTPTFGPLYYTQQLVPRFSERFSASYVTGGHTFKAGLQLEEIYLRAARRRTAPTIVEYTFNNQVPVSLTQWATPYGLRSEDKDLRLLRAGSVDSPAPDAHLRPPLRLLQRVHTRRRACRPRRTAGSPARSFAEVKNVPLLEGLRSARRRGVRPLRQRPDRAEGGARPLRLEVGHHRSPRPTIRSRRPSTPSPARGTTASTRSAIRAAATTCRTATSSNRGVNGECGAMANQNFGGNFRHHPLCRRCAARLRRARLQLGFHGRSAARAAARRVDDAAATTATGSAASWPPTTSW